MKCFQQIIIITRKSRNTRLNYLPITKKNSFFQKTHHKINIYVYFCGEIIIYEKKLIIGIA